MNAYMVRVRYRTFLGFKRSYMVATEKAYSQVSADFADMCSRFPNDSFELFAVRGKNLYTLERQN